VASYKLQIKPSAAKELENLPKQDRLRVIERIRRLADDPRGPGTEKLSGAEKYRVRQGNYRIIFMIEDRIITVIILKIGDRKEVYR
jgi:mRNA interferase RelE/StbE